MTDPLTQVATSWLLHILPKYFADWSQIYETWALSFSSVVNATPTGSFAGGSVGHPIDRGNPRSNFIPGLSLYSGAFIAFVGLHCFRGFIVLGGLYCIPGPSLHSGALISFGCFLCIRGSSLHSGAFIAFRGPSLHSGVFIAFGDVHCISGLALHSRAFIGFWGFHCIWGFSLHSGLFIAFGLLH